jgi:hypothetical protein
MLSFGPTLPFLLFYSKFLSQKLSGAASCLRFRDSCLIAALAPGYNMPIFSFHHCLLYAICLSYALSRKSL